MGGNVSVLPAMHFIPHVEDASRALFHTCEMLSNALNALPDLTSRAPPVCLSPLSGFLFPSLPLLFVFSAHVTHTHAVRTATPSRAYSVAHLLAIQIRAMKLSPQNVGFFFFSPVVPFW